LGESFNIIFSKLDIMALAKCRMRRQPGTCKAARGNRTPGGPLQSHRLRPFQDCDRMQGDKLPGIPALARLKARELDVRISKIAGKYGG
jgi:hypothetical protein